MPLVRNASGRDVMVPAGHWALTDPEFTILPEPEPKPAPVADEPAKPKAAPRARKSTK